MALDRDSVKADIEAKEQSDPELSGTMANAHKQFAEITKIKNKHELDKMKAQRGIIGCLFGRWSNVPMFIALISVIFGAFAFYDFMNNAVEHKDNQQFWSESAKIALAFSSAALGYIFGRGTSAE